MTTLSKPISGKIKPGSLSPWFDRFFRNDLGEWLGKEFLDTMPSVNVSETKNNFQLELAAPGLKKEDFNIRIENDVLMISCEHESDVKKEEKEFTRREYNYSSFSRSFSLPENVLKDKIEATYNEGILKLLLPKSEVTESNPQRKITVS